MKRRICSLRKDERVSCKRIPCRLVKDGICVNEDLSAQRCRSACKIVEIQPTDFCNDCKYKWQCLTNASISTYEGNYKYY